MPCISTLNKQTEKLNHFSSLRDYLNLDKGERKKIIKKLQNEKLYEWNDLLRK